MPVFTEHSEASRDERVDRVKAFPLPRPEKFYATRSHDRTARDSFGGNGEYEVVVVGAGPSGLLLSLLLARLGLSDTHLLAIDSKAGTVKSGQADGLQPRTLEVLQQLGLAHEVLTEGCQMHEVGFWNPASAAAKAENKKTVGKVDEKGRGILRTGFAPDVAVPARYPHEVTIHQGRIERILLEDLHKYSRRGIAYNWQFEGYTFTAASDEYPIAIQLRSLADQSIHAIKTKYIIGADGAHSAVRRAMDLHLEGESSDHIWGVMDLVCATDFPDIRKRCAIHSDTGSVMIIPRERISTGDYLTRIYSQMDNDVPADEDELAADEDTKKESAKKRRGETTLEKILAQAQSVFHPYKFEINPGGDVDWWAAYQIGQRMTNSFIKRDPEDQKERVFIAGDACHTHSPKAGQGQNVSMMDSYNLSWKLAHVIFNHAPHSVLSTYETERLGNAKDLIEFDRKFSSMFSGKIGAGSELTHDAFLEVFRKGSGFTSGAGIQYRPSAYVDENVSAGILEAKEGSELIPGRRVRDSVLLRFSDENPRHLHDELSFNGKFRLLLFCPDEVDVNASFAVVSSSPEEPSGILRNKMVEPIFLHTKKNVEMEWEDWPAWLRSEFEWKVFDGRAAYDTFGVRKEVGAFVVVRPDGVVGGVYSWAELARVVGYFNQVLVN